MKSSFLVIVLLAVLCAFSVVLGQTTAPTIVPTTTTPITQQPQQVQDFVKSVNSTLSAIPTKANSKLRFLRQILKNLKELGLVKRPTEQAPYNAKDAAITMEKIVKISQHLLKLKKEGKTEDVEKYVADLKKSKNFAEAVRLVRRVMRRSLRRKVRKLASTVRQVKLAAEKSAEKKLDKALIKKQLKALIAKKFGKLPISRMIKRAPSMTKFVKKFQLSAIAAIPSFRATLVSGIAKRQTRSVARRFPRRQQNGAKRQTRRAPRRQAGKRQTRRAPRKSVRRFPRRQGARRFPRRAGRRQFPQRRFARRFPVRRQTKRAFPQRRFARRFPQRRSIRRFPRRQNGAKRQTRRFPRRQAGKRQTRRFPQKRTTKRVARKSTKVQKKPFMVINKDLLKNVIQAWEKRVKPAKAL